MTSPVWSSTSIPASAFDQSVFEDGLAFDEPVRGFQSIHESDMMLLPDPETAQIDPFRSAKTLNLNFPSTTRSPASRTRAIRATSPARRRTTSPPPVSPTPRTSAPRREFYIFDSISYDSKINGAFYEIDSESKQQTPVSHSRPTARTWGYKVRAKGGYFPVAPYDHYVDLRDEMSTNLINAGFTLERGHHEVGTAGQAEINYKFDTLLAAADDVLLFKYIIKNTAWQNGKSVTFMPKLLVR